MIKLGRVTDLVMIQSYPDEIQSAVLDILEILDSNYGAERDVKLDYGGFVLFTESAGDFPEIEKELGQNMAYDGIPEYVDIVRCKNKEVFTVSLFIVSTEFSVAVVMPYRITPDNLISYIE